MKTNTITRIVALGIISALCLAGHANEPPAAVKEKSSLDLVLIPAGPFQMGDGLNELRKTMKPHWVHVSDFHIAKYAVTKQLWEDVRDWAVGNGYHFDRKGIGKENDHPIVSMNWFDAVKWCNALSQKAGLQPYYYEDFEFTTVYKSGRLRSPFVKWDANGYRLPTEAEWEKAARGGLTGKRFPWGDTITHSNANYNSSEKLPYDISPTRGHHPDYKTGSTPHTSPVGSFAPNGYGLYDMAGNAYAWCWNWDNLPYCPAPNPAEPIIDPLGPPSGTARSRRGGCWYDTLHFGGRTAHRFGGPPMHIGSEWGLRLARSGEKFKVGWKNYDWGNDIAVDSSGKVYLASYRGGMKYDANGNQLWKIDRKCSRVAVDSSGNAYFACHSSIMKCNADGKPLWEKDGKHKGIAVDSAGNVYVTGDTEVSGVGCSDVLTIKYGADGNQLWKKTSGENECDGGNGLAVDSSGNVYVTAEAFTSDAYKSEAWTIKFDANGNQLWNKISGDGVFNGGYGIAVNSVGDIYVTGYTQSALNGSPDVWRIEYAGSSVTDAEKTQKETKPEKPLR